MNQHFVLKPSVIAVALALGTTQFAMAQDGATTSAPQTVYVTGSNIKRTDKEGTAPISVMSAADIKATGATTVADLMKYVPSMGTDGNQDFVGSNSFSKGASTASLRGLGSSSTLVLLNGRRMNPAPYADPNTGNSVIYDLNSIPVSAIERVEVLADGASAIYGSDAIAGVAPRSVPQFKANPRFQVIVSGSGRDSIQAFLRETIRINLVASLYQG